MSESILWPMVSGSSRNPSVEFIESVPTRGIIARLIGPRYTVDDTAISPPSSPRKPLFTERSHNPYEKPGDVEGAYAFKAFLAPMGWSVQEVDRCHGPLTRIKLDKDQSSIQRLKRKSPSELKN